MNRLWTTVTIILLLLVFIGYMVFDLALKKNPAKVTSISEADSVIKDNWIVTKIFEPGKGRLNAVTVTGDGKILIGGESFIACYDSGFILQWEYKSSMPVSALTFSQNKVYAVTGNLIEVINMVGEKTEEWGPYGDRSLITSISSNDTFVALADAAGKLIYILDKEGVVKHIIGQSEEPFIIPSSYFDVVLGDDNTVYAANTGKRRIEKRNIEGSLIDFFGEEGTAPGAFCGCCNPAHFAVVPGGFITAEKGINRIKTLNVQGDFIEAVSFSNSFTPSIPLDLASIDGSVIFAANPADSKLYLFKRK